MRPPPLPLDLPRLVMRRAIGVGLITLLLATLLGLQRAGENIDDEVNAAMTLAGLMARLGSLTQTDDRSALESLRAVQASDELRHLALHIYAADGTVLLAPPAPQPASPALAWLFALHRELLSAPDARQVAWQVARPQGAPWTVSLAASHESERREALTNLAGMITLLLTAIGGLLLAMRWNVRRAFQPLAGLLGAIERIEQHDARAVQTLLPPMPIRELEVIAAALRQLSDALDRAELQRRLLSQKVLTLQEDERSHLARELHDEFGQRLTALRFDAAWLAKRLADQPESLAVVRGMAERCAEVQRDIRELLVRLNPLGPAAGDGADTAPIALARLLQLLGSLVQSWRAHPARSGTSDDTSRTEFRLQVGVQPPGTTDDSVSPLSAEEAEQLGLPRELALALYRLSQEALTNAARHAQASQVTLRLIWQRAAAPEQPEHLIWQAQDDGIGIADPAAAMQRGNGLGGMQERVWALGGDWQWGAATTTTIGDPGPPARPGLRLRASLPLPLSIPPPPSLP
jgi:two-component system sensor histidine kinase UhpB